MGRGAKGRNIMIVVSRRLQIGRYKRLNQEIDGGSAGWHRIQKVSGTGGERKGSDHKGGEKGHLVKTLERKGKKRAISPSTIGSNMGPQQKGVNGGKCSRGHFYALLTEKILGW